MAGRELRFISRRRGRAAPNPPPQSPVLPPLLGFLALAASGGMGAAGLGLQTLFCLEGHVAAASNATALVWRFGDAVAAFCRMAYVVSPRVGYAGM